MKVTVPGWRPCKVFARSDGHRVREQFFQRAILASFNFRCLSGASKFTLYSLKTWFLRLGLREQGEGQDWDAGDLIS